jgi:hypothetical protein
MNERVNGKLVITITCKIWMTLMIGVRYFSYEYKPTVRS